MDNHQDSDKNKEISNTQNVSTHTNMGLSPISLFKKDKDFVFVHQKAEKLVSAVYMLTNFLPTEESMKWSLRRLGMELLRVTIDLKEESTVSRSTSENVMRNTILEMTSLLEVAQFAGLVSEMNVSILKREFHSLLSFVHEMLHRKIGVDQIFGAALHVDAPTHESVQSVQNRPVISSQKVDTNFSEIEGNDMSVIKDKTDNIQTKSHGLKEYSPVAVKKNKRQSAIISLLKRKKEIMVRDVSEVIHDCSEKTIQRELLALVSQGVLTKEGERRWTKYSLAV